jgi:hypothetical protein
MLESRPLQKLAGRNLGRLLEKPVRTEFDGLLIHHWLARIIDNRLIDRHFARPLARGTFVAVTAISNTDTGGTLS